jgi:hypothetical protein
MSRLSETVHGMVDTSSINHSNIMLGKILEVDTQTEQLKLYIDRNGTFRYFSNVPYPRGLEPKVHSLCVVGFIDGSSILPVVLSLYSPSLLYTATQEEGIPNKGPLYIQSF